MKTHRAILVLFVFCLSAFAQEIQEKAVAVNIEVPVRVFKGDEFVKDLTIEDFLLYENGTLQTVEAVYLIEKARLEKEETRLDTKNETKIFTPPLSRQFVLIFEIREFFAEVEKTIKYFFNDVILPTDRLIVATPLRTYSFKADSWKYVSRADMADQMIKKLKRDTLIRPVDWGNFDDYLNYDDMNRRDMEDVFFGQRYIDGENLQNIADYLKSLPGQKNVFLFLQQELIDYAMPIYINSVPGIMSSLDYLTIYSQIAAYGQVSNKIKKAYADSTILFNLIYLKNTKVVTSGSLLNKIDLAAGIFSTFKDLTKITGGLAQTTANVTASFKTAVDASENYYLLYYSPKDYVADGKYKRIRVQVKGQKYRIIHRSGYIAD